MCVGEECHSRNERALRTIAGKQGVDNGEQQIEGREDAERRGHVLCAYPTLR